MQNENEHLFEELRALDLPKDQYVVVASGPLGIRNLRKMSDVDVLVNDELWKELSTKYPMIFEHKASKLRISPNIEAFCATSFGPGIPEAPTAAQQISESEIIDGLPFQNIETALFFKSRGTRDKDIRDVELLEGWLRENS